jgi:hypothetical protein
VEQQTHSLWPNQEQLLFYINYLLTFIQFSDFYQEASFWGEKHIPQIFAKVFQNSKHSQEKKPLIKNIASISHLSLFTMNIDNITQNQLKTCTK